MSGHPTTRETGGSDTGIRFIRHAGKPAVFRAGWVIKNPCTILENAGIEVAGGRIQQVLDNIPSDRPVVDCGPGILMPALVNAHLHLELSALKDQLPLGQGFAPWVAALLEKRQAAGIHTLMAAAEKAVQSLSALGVGIVGEVSTLGITREALDSLAMAGVWFREYLGFTNEKAVLEKRSPLSVSVAGHAPHTTSSDLLISLKRCARTAGLPLSIHVAESDAEMDFIAGDRGDWHDFLVSRGIDPSKWPVGGKTPVAYLNELGLLDPHTLAVHLLRITDGDLDILARARPCICLCPRSNHNLHGRLPDIRAMMEQGLAPALGTDSLASCSSLSIFDEMAFVRRHYSDIRPEDILAMATVNGARVLGLEGHYGTLESQRQSEFIYLDSGPVSRAQVMEKVTSYGSG